MKTKNNKKAIGKNFVKVSSIPKKTAKKAQSVVVPAPVNPLLGALIEEDNFTLTENSAKTFKSTLNHVLDFFAMGAALRPRAEVEVVSLFTKAFAEDPLLALKALFNVRNVRGGAGERKVFRNILKYLGDNYPDVVKKNLDNIAYFGRYDDLYSLFDTKVEKDVLALIEQQINADVESYNNNKPISLLPKWLCSENASSKQTKLLAKKIRNYLGWTSEQYRKTLSALRSYSNVVEVKMCAGQWNEIDYSKVPSRASLIYRKAFPRHDEEGYKAFLESVKKGEVKINADTLYPYDIARKVLFECDSSDTLDVLWDNLPNYMEDSERNILVVADTSGSMTCDGGFPLSVSVSLALYTAERNKGPFGGYFITFSSTPSLQKVIGRNVRERILNLSKAEWGMSTNLQAVFNLVLDNAVKNKVKPEDMPAQILILSDMEFNACTENSTNLDAIRNKYKIAGYEIPQLIFWNVHSRRNNVPALAGENGVLLVSGASPSVFKTLLSGKQYTPVDQMLATLNNPMYDRVVV